MPLRCSSAFVVATSLFCQRQMPAFQFPHADFLKLYFSDSITGSAIRLQVILFLNMGKLFEYIWYERVEQKYFGSSELFCVITILQQKKNQYVDHFRAWKFPSNSGGTNGLHFP